jgi:uncharacterized membrane protein
MKETFTWTNIIFAIIFILIGIYVGDTMSYSNIPDTIIVKEREVDTLKVVKDNFKYKYLESKKTVYLRDSIYIADKTLEKCDSLVEAQRIALKNCDTLQVFQEKIIYKLDTIVNLQKVYIQESKGRKPRIGPFVGVGLNPDGSIRPTLGGGIVF